jgi:prophage maintenance system killer protein
MDPVFLSIDEVLEIHLQQIERYGGSAGLRDAAGLESAVATPQATFGGEFLHSSIPAMAAAHLFHLCLNHAFVDGNKRTGANPVADPPPQPEDRKTYQILHPFSRTMGCPSLHPNAL